MGLLGARRGGSSWRSPGVRGIETSRSLLLASRRQGRGWSAVPGARASALTLNRLFESLAVEGRRDQPRQHVAVQVRLHHCYRIEALVHERRVVARQIDGAAVREPNIGHPMHELRTVQFGGAPAPWRLRRARGIDLGQDIVL